VGGRRRRDPRFREEILRIYERRCAVCGYDGRLGTTDLAIEAAHIKWHAAGGPDAAENGLALCSFHHVALEPGRALARRFASLSRIAARERPHPDGNAAAAIRRRAAASAAARRADAAPAVPSVASQGGVPRSRSGRLMVPQRLRGTPAAAGGRRLAVRVDPERDVSKGLRTRGLVSGRTAAPSRIRDGAIAMSILTDTFVPLYRDDIPTSYRAWLARGGIPMNRRDILQLLQAHRDELRSRFGVSSIALFGSYARDEARADSDVDLLVEFEGRVTFLGYMGLVEYLETVLGTRVDVGTFEKLKPRVRPYVERELIRVA
jgi:uncharacterized protein